MGAFLSAGMMRVRSHRPDDAVRTSQMRSPQGPERERTLPGGESVARASQNLAALRREISTSASALSLREMDRSALDSHIANLELLIRETELLASRELPGDCGAVVSPEKIRMLREYLDDVKSYSCRTFSATMSEQLMAHLDLLRSREIALKEGLPDEGLWQQTAPNRLQQIASGGGAGLGHNEDETAADVGQSRRQGADAPYWEIQQRRGEAGAEALLCETTAARPCSACKANAALPGRGHGLCRACLALATCHQRLDTQHQLRVPGPSTPQQPQPKAQQAPTAVAVASLQDLPTIPPRPCSLSDHHGRPVFSQPPPPLRASSTLPMAQSNKRKREEGKHVGPDEPRPGTEGNRMYHDEQLRPGLMLEGERPTSKVKEPKRLITSAQSVGGVVSAGESARAAITRDLEEAAAKPPDKDEEAQRDGRRKRRLLARPCLSSPGAMMRAATRAPRKGGDAPSSPCSAKPAVDVLQPMGSREKEADDSPAEEEPSLGEAGDAADSDDEDKGGSGESRQYYSAADSVSIADTEVVTEHQMVTGTIAHEHQVADDDDYGPLSHDEELMAEAAEAVRGSDTEVVEEEEDADAGFLEDQGGAAELNGGHDAVAADVGKDCVGFFSADVGKARTSCLGADDSVHQSRRSSLEIKKGDEASESHQGASSCSDDGADETGDACSTEPQVEIASDEEEDDEEHVEMEGKGECKMSSENEENDEENKSDDG